MRPALGYEALEYLTDEVVFINREDRRIVFVSPSVEPILGYTCEAFTELSTVELIHPADMAAAVETSLAMRADEGASYRSTLRVRRADGSYVWCEIVGRNLLHTEVQGIVNTLRDVSERRAHEDQLVRLARQDELTGLQNRRAFLDELERAVKESDGVGIGVLILDLDGFKAVNDRLGHLAGDELMRRCARDIGAALRVGDLAARLGGDEFAVLCRRIAGSEALVTAAERVRLAAAGVRELREGQALVTVSVGARLGARGDAPIDLIRAADEALYQAKDAGRDRVVLAGDESGA